jgi:hypothetical protein
MAAPREGLYGEKEREKRIKSIQNLKKPACLDCAKLSIWDIQNANISPIAAPVIRVDDPKIVQIINSIHCGLYGSYGDGLASLVGGYDWSVAHRFRGDLSSSAAALLCELCSKTR